MENCERFYICKIRCIKRRNTSKKLIPGSGSECTVKSLFTVNVLKDISSKFVSRVI